MPQTNFRSIKIPFIHIYAGLYSKLLGSSKNGINIIPMNIVHKDSKK